MLSLVQQQLTLTTRREHTMEESTRVHEEHVRRQHLNGVHSDCDRAMCRYWRESDLEELCPLGGVLYEGDVYGAFCTLDPGHDGDCLYDDVPLAFVVQSGDVERCPLKSLDAKHYYPSTGQCRCFCEVARKLPHEDTHTPCRKPAGHDGLCDFGS